MLCRLRNWLREYFTRVVYEDQPIADAVDVRGGFRKPLIRRRRYRRVTVPSERFLWAMVVLIVALVGLVAIEIAYVLVTCTINNEILIVISGVVGAIVSRFLEAKH